MTEAAPIVLAIGSPPRVEPKIPKRTILANNVQPAAMIGPRFQVASPKSSKPTDTKPGMSVQAYAQDPQSPVKLL